MLNSMKKKKHFAHKCYVYAFFSLRLCIKAVKPFSDSKYRDATFWDFPFKSRNISHYYMHLCCKASILYELYFFAWFFFVLLLNLFGLCMFNNCSCRKQKTDIHDLSIENSISIPVRFLYTLSHSSTSRNTNSCS